MMVLMQMQDEDGDADFPATAGDLLLSCEASSPSFELINWRLTQCIQRKVIVH